MRRYAWSGKRREEIKEVLGSLGIKYLSPKLIHKVRFLSASGVTSALNRTLADHLSKAFDDEGNDAPTRVDPNELESDVARIRVTAAEVSVRII